MKKNVWRALPGAAVCAAVFLLPYVLSAQVKAPFSLSLTPGVQLPLGPLNTDGSALFATGASVALDGELAIPAVPVLSAIVSVGYTLAPTVAGTNLSLLSLGIGPMITLSPLPRFDLQFSARGGYSAAVYHTRAEGTPFVSGDAKALYSLTRGFALGAGASYQHHFGVYNGFGFFLGGSYRLGTGPSRLKTDLDDVEFEPVFPVFSKYYDDHPVGRLMLRNGESGPIRNVKVSFMVPQYMVAPKLCATLPAMRPGEKKPVELFALFTEVILAITEDTKADAQVIIEYTYMDSLVSGQSGQTLRVYNRNAMTWDDDRKAAAFVTSKDPEVMKFSKAVVGGVRERGATAVSVKLREAMGLFSALKACGVSYVQDPTGSFVVRHDRKTAVDYLQFPVQTLQYKAGDCDDLAICYCALLESTGTPTAIITVPGHIFMAFDVGVDPAETRKTFSRPDDLIVKVGATWVPVEITMIRDGFLAAWQAGARQWKEASAAGTARFYTTQEARSLYEPAAFAGIGVAAEAVQMDRVGPVYDAELARFVDGEIRDRVAELRTETADRSNDPRPLNKLGVLYARFGMYDKALVELARAADMGFAPAQVNLGNIALLQGDPQKSLGFFDQVVRKEPNNLAALIGTAKANYELENMGSVRALYKQIEALDASAAARLSYLVSKGDESARAAEAGRHEVRWDERD